MTKYMEPPVNPGKDDGRCGLCKAPGLGEDDRCHGCGYTVCEDCDKGAVWGPHYVVDHQEEEY